jgi:hypothetical protein
VQRCPSGLPSILSTLRTYLLEQSVEVAYNGGFAQLCTGSPSGCRRRLSRRLCRSKTRLAVAKSLTDPPCGRMSQGMVRLRGRRLFLRPRENFFPTWSGTARYPVFADSGYVHHHARASSGRKSRRCDGRLPYSKQAVSILQLWCTLVNACRLSTCTEPTLGITEGNMAKKAKKAKKAKTAKKKKK